MPKLLFEAIVIKWMHSNDAKKTKAVFFASLPSLRVPLLLDAISVVPRCAVSGFCQNTESNVSPLFPISFLPSHNIFGCMGATQGWEMLHSLKCSNLLVQCLAPGHRPMKLRVSSFHPSFSNGKTARRCALQCLGYQDRSQQQKWVTESVLQCNKSPKMQFSCGTLLL